MCLLNIATCSFGTLRMFVLLLIEVLTVINGSQVTLEGGLSYSTRPALLVGFVGGTGARTAPTRPGKPWLLWLSRVPEFLFLGSLCKSESPEPQLDCLECPSYNTAGSFSLVSNPSLRTLLILREPEAHEKSESFLTNPPRPQPPTVFSLSLW